MVALALATVATGFAAPSVQAGEPSIRSEDRTGFYFPLQIGTGFGTTVDGDVLGYPWSADTRTSVNGQIGIGYDFGTIRAEWRSVYNQTSYNNTKVLGYDTYIAGTSEFFGGASGLAADIPTGSRLEPYVGVDLYGGYTDGYPVAAISPKAGLTLMASEKIDLFTEVSYTVNSGVDTAYGRQNPSGEFGVSGGVRIRI